MKLVLKKFQEDAIIELRKVFLDLWKANNRRADLIFKSPTGSGKTIMMAEFLKELTGDPRFDEDKAFVWLTFSEDSYEQSKQKLNNYYDGAGEIDLLDLNDLSRKKLEKNNIFFINWQKIKSSTKEGRKLRKETEKTSYDNGLFDDFILKTKEDGREIILIIDEAHIQTGTELAEEIINLLDPRIILHITATPRYTPDLEDVQDKKAGFIRVKREDVIEAGLIKEKVITQTKEDLQAIAKKELDQDLALLELAFNKRLEIKRYFKELKIDYINPLVLIQLPNDDVARKETLDKSKKEIVEDYLRDKGIKDQEMAVWLSEEKENLEEIEKNDSNVSFLIFKQAAATGWDCPRAHILVMFREIRNPTFHTQTIGRILRMPEAEHYKVPELNLGYLYTNYSRNQIDMPDNKQGENKPFIYVSNKKVDIKPIKVDSIYLSRISYNDLGWKFQFTFEKVADVYFKIKNSNKADKVKEIEKGGIKIKNVKIVDKLIVDAEIENYDNFIKEVKEKGGDLNREISINDLERMYNLLCFNIIAKQEEDDKKFAPERSWGRLKTALNVWFNKRLNVDREEYYKIIVHDLLRQDSVLQKIISKSLAVHKPIRDAEMEERAVKNEKIINLEIPRESSFYTEDYEILKIEGDNLNNPDSNEVSKCAMEPFYIKSSYIGKKNEVLFIEYLESKKSVSWWHKQGDSGTENFAVKYFNDQEQKAALFYPDWVVRLNNKKILILDTKGGQTAKDLETKNKSEALQKWSLLNNNFIVGITVQVSGIWKINTNKKYEWDPNYKDWEDLDKYIT